MTALRSWLTTRSRSTRWLLGAAAVLCLGLVGYRGYQEVAANSHFHAAEAASRADDPATARRHLLACLEQWPDSGEVLFYLARASRRDGDFTAARKYLKQAEAFGWTPEAIQIEQALLRAQAGNFRQVEADLNRWAALETDDQPLFFEVLVPEAIQRGDTLAAYGMLTAWTARRPENVQAQVWLADVSERLKRFEDAQTAAKAAAKYAPDRADIQRRCGQLLIEFNQAADALPYFDRALELNPTDQGAKLGRAKCLNNLGDPPAAAALADEVLAVNPADANALRFRGNLALQAGDAATAEKLLTRSLAVAPAELETLSLLALAAERLERPAEAQSYRDRHAAAKKDLETLTELNRRIAENPRDPAPRHEAGVLLIRNGLTAAGVRFLQSALVEDPAFQPALKALADVRSKPPESPALSGPARNPGP